MNAITLSNDQALAIFAHELREPLAAILFATDAMTASAVDQGANREMCAIVQRQSQYVARMIDNVLELGRSRAGKTCLHKDWLDLDFVAAHAIEATSALLMQRRHHLKVSLPTERVLVMADSLRVQQIIINLLTNAAKYTNYGGSIQLTIEATGDLVVIEVTDNGIGIPSTLLPRVFDVFEQGDEPLVAVGAGLGIGLALVKSLVDLHGGSVCAQSDGENLGSKFVVRLPALIARGRDDDAPRETRLDFFPLAPDPAEGFMGDA